MERKKSDYFSKETVNSNSEAKSLPKSKSFIDSKKNSQGNDSEEFRDLVELNKKKDVLISKILEITKNDPEIFLIIEDVFKNENTKHTKNFQINEIRIKEYEEEISSFQRKFNLTVTENEKLKKEYYALLNEKFPKLDEYREKLMDYKLLNEKDKFKKEKEMLVNDLNNRVKKVIYLLINYYLK